MAATERRKPVTPILIAILVAFALCAVFYYFVVIPERERFVERTMKRLEVEAAHWKELATSLTQRGLLFRELPLLNEDVEALNRPPRETGEGDDDETLKQLEAKMADYDNELNFATEGELGERRLLARQIALKKRDSDLKDKSELATEHSVNTFGAEDMEHLRTN